MVNPTRSTRPCDGSTTSGEGNETSVMMEEGPQGRKGYRGRSTFDLEVYVVIERVGEVEGCK